MFQNQVNTVQAPGVTGDFASTNPFSSVLSAAGGLVAPAGGLIVGNFAWVGPLGQVSQSYTSGWQVGFLGRNEQGLITAFLGETSLNVPAGFMVTLFNGGDFWAYFANGATAGATVYANETTGAPEMQATNVVTGSLGFTGTATTVSLSPIITITATTDGILNIGDTITTGAEGIDGGIVESFGTYTQASGVGTVTLNVAATGAATSEALVTTSNYLYVSAVADGGVSIGDTFTGSGVPSGFVISGYGTGSGGTGTYTFTVNGDPTQENNDPVTMTGSANVSTGWTVGPITLVGAGVAKITHAVA